MATLQNAEPRAPWTWADLLSTYRYWGLFLAYVFSEAAAQSMYSFVFIRFREVGFEEYSRIAGVSRFVWVLLVLLLAWIAIRTRPVRVLLIVAILAAATSLVWFIPGVPITVVGALTLLFVPLLNGLLLVVLVAALAGARGGYATTLVGFGLAWIIGLLFAFGITPLTGEMVSESGPAAANWCVTLLLVAVAIVLIPVRGELFTADPPPRGRALAPVQRDPVLTAILSWLLPFYVVYWLYRIHGEEAHLRPSRQLLSPRAAAWIAVIPVLGDLMLPIMLSTLADHHNEVAAEAGAGRVQRPWVAFLWTLLILPVAVGMLQSNLNKLAASANRQALAAGTAN